MAKLTGTNKLIADEISAVFKKHGMVMGTYRVTFSEFEHSFSIKARKTVTDSGAAIDKHASAKRDFQAWHLVNEFKLEWLGKEFSYGGRRMRLEGFNMSKPKNYVVMTEVSTGKTFIAPGDHVRQALQFATKTSAVS